MLDSPHRIILTEAKNPWADASRAAGSIAPLRLTLAWVLRLPVRGLDAALWLYQRTLSPALNLLNPHGGCRFAPTCSCYAREALRVHGLFTGVGLTVTRLAKCGPWHPGGEDPVPPANHQTTGRQDHGNQRRSSPSCYSVRRPSSVVPSSLSHG